MRGTVPGKQYIATPKSEMIYSKEKLGEGSRDCGWRSCSTGRPEAGGDTPAPDVPPKPSEEDVT